MLKTPSFVQKLIDEVKSILEKILEHWYNTRLYNYEMDEAQNLLLDVLKESRIDPIFITRIEDSLSKSTRL